MRSKLLSLTIRELLKRPKLFVFLLFLAFTLMGTPVIAEDDGDPIFDPDPTP